MGVNGIYWSKLKITTTIVAKIMLDCIMRLTTDANSKVQIFLRSDQSLINFLLRPYFWMFQPFIYSSLCQ
ncbi:hypothetical protein FGO68_gene10276 [Halteria grandinella]|uniref:Uncharacterized protein n=1 Tax=Halteria grandinella TaxID=5974 RepID=A0A8J8SZH8_HALGN|nr:hypothetical protein FGO68_gene10276 [Halteria grandinella]